MRNYQITNRRNSIRLKDPKNGYWMKLNTAPYESSLEQVVFFVPFNNISTMPVTARNLEQYHHACAKIDWSRHFRLIEVGAGLGAFTPDISCKTRQYGYEKPVIIDPVDYNALHRMLSHSSNLDLPDRLFDRINLLRNRCETILDPEMITLVNKSLEDAMESQPSLLKSADYVVDCCGASMYPTDAFLTKHGLDPDKAKRLLGALERQLLNNSGVIFHLHPLGE